MHPTMDQIIGSLSLSPECPARATAEEHLLERKEEDDMMKVLGGGAEEELSGTSVVSLGPGPGSPGRAQQDPEESKSSLLAGQSEKDLQRLKQRQIQLQERFSSLNKRIQALRSFKFGSHVAEQLLCLKDQAQAHKRPSPHSSTPALPSHATHPSPAPPKGPKAECLKEQRMALSRMESQLKFLFSSSQGLDSDATESSSGGESCDESEGFPSTNTGTHPIAKRAKWTWLQNRASLASKWAWLTAQVSDLEFKIRQHTELYKQIRASKEPLLLLEPLKPKPAEDLNTQEVRTLFTPEGKALRIKEALCPPERLEAEANGASRTRPLKPTFSRRRVLFSKQLNRNCSCPDRWCSSCFGSRGNTSSVALLDHSYHHVISSKTGDVSLDLHMMTKLKNRAWLHAKETPSSSSGSHSSVPATSLPSTLHPLSKHPEDRSSKKPPKKSHHKKSEETSLEASEATTSSPSNNNTNSKSKKKKKKSSSSEKSRRRSSLSGAYEGSSFQEYISDEEDLLDSSPLPSPSIGGGAGENAQNRSWLEHVKRRRESAYDIDNIVIPYSIAASTRVERIKYKEIITPTWRVIDEASQGTEEEEKKKEEEPKNKEHHDVQEEEEEEDEDICESIYEERHRKAELEEQRRWKALPFKQTGGQRSRRQDSEKTETGGSGCNTPDPLSPGMVVESLEVSTRPSTPLLPSEDAPSTPQSIRERRRTTSSTSNFSPLPRSSTPNSGEILLDSLSLPPPHPPFEARSFPISEEDYAKMNAEMPTPKASAAADESLGTLSSEQKRRPPTSQKLSDESINNNNNNNNNNHDHHPHQSCDSCTDEDEDYTMDWNGDDPNDPEWGTEPASNNNNNNNNTTSSSSSNNRPKSEQQH